MTRLLACLFSVAVALSSATLATAASPGANGRIAFVSDRYGSDEILTAGADGSDVQRLTATPQDESSPAVSPDGSRIAFARNQDIWVMNADGSGQTQLTGTEGSGEASPAWSPDGTRIVFVSNRAAPGGGTTGPELWVMNADGSGVRRLTDTTGASSLAPAWSPTADVIAFHSNVNAGGFDIYTIGASSTPGAGTDSRVRVTNNFVSDEHPSWSPDGARIAFERGNGTAVGDSTKELWAMDADGTDAAALTANGDYDADPVWSPDGTRIAYASNAGGGDLEVVSMPAAGGAAAPVTDTSSGIGDDQPDWSVAYTPPPPPPPPAPASAAAPAPAADGHGPADARLWRQGRGRSRPGARLPHPRR